MTDDRERDDDMVAALRDHTKWLAGGLPGSLRRMSVRAGDARIDVEWQPNAGDPAVPADVGADRPPAEAQPMADDDHVLLASPMVGTFYRAPDPNSPPFVEIGDTVQLDQPIAIIEAMKLFNPINAECAGVVVEVLVDDATPVEFGQPLFRVAVAA